MARGENQKLKLLYLLDILNTYTDDEHFIAVVSVAVSKQFLGWVIALGDGVKIVGPEQFGFNKKSHIIQSVVLTGGSVVLAGVCALVW